MHGFKFPKDLNKSDWNKKLSFRIFNTYKLSQQLKSGIQEQHELCSWEEGTSKLSKSFKWKWLEKSIKLGWTKLEQQSFLGKDFRSMWEGNKFYLFVMDLLKSYISQRVSNKELKNARCMVINNFLKP